MIGERIGNFRIVSRLGAGGMGVVYLGSNDKVGTRVAIKVLQPQVSVNPELVTRFLNEAIAAGKIQHAGIGKIFDAGVLDNGRAYLVMELLEGEVLAARIKRLGRLPLVQVIDIGKQITSVLDAVRVAGITHRDLKPDNIFVVPDSELASGERVKIVDFGIAKLSIAGDLTATASGNLGTPAYMSPEQWIDMKTVDWRADVYSLGCVVFEMVAGRPPFSGITIGELCTKHLHDEPQRLGAIAAVPVELDALVARLLAKAPEQRPSLREIASELGALRDSIHAGVGATLALPDKAGSDTLSAIVSTGKRDRGKPTLYVGLAGDAPRMPPARIGLAAADRVDIGRSDARRIERRRAAGADVVAVALVDPRMSTHHARLSRVGGAWLLEDLQSKNGTWLGAQRVTRKQLEDGDAIVVGHTVLVFRDHGGEDHDLDGAPAALAPGLVTPSLSTLSPALAARYRELAAAARAAVPIELAGEPGTGKQLAARAIHTLSGRAGAFVAVKCGDVTDAAIAGHVGDAAGGTLFLAAIGELPLAAQVALLRALDATDTDARIVTATSRELAAEVAAGRFRADLRARLLGAVIELPPLRNRREDLGLLVAMLLDRLAPGRTVAFTADAVGALYAHDWPLNIRELERALAAALAVATDRIEVQHLPKKSRITSVS